MMSRKEYDQRIEEFKAKVKADPNSPWTFGETSRVLNFISDLIENHDVEGMEYNRKDPMQ